MSAYQVSHTQSVELCISRVQDSWPCGLLVLSNVEWGNIRWRKQELKLHGGVVFLTIRYVSGINMAGRGRETSNSYDGWLRGSQPARRR
jgi:hypothetical protein